MNLQAASSTACVSAHYSSYPPSQMSGSSTIVHPTYSHPTYDARLNAIQTENAVTRIPCDDQTDDEDIGDEFSEDELHEVEQFRKATSENFRVVQVDVTKQLLQFAEVVNQDIQKYFSKNKDVGGCDIYEDKWPPSKSGRELYYADLVRVAQGAEDDDDNRPEKDKSNEQKTYSGKMNPTVGIGPFSELFAHLNTVDTAVHAAGQDADEHSINVTSSEIPMNARKLPISFFVEPKHVEDRMDCTKHVVDIAKTIVGCTKAPDFSDLLESWTGLEETSANYSKHC